MFRTLVSSIIRWHVTLFFVIIFMINMIRIIHHAQHHHHSLHHLASFTDPLASSETSSLQYCYNHHRRYLHHLISVKMAENYEEVVRGWGYNMPEVKKQNHHIYQQSSGCLHFDNKFHPRWLLRKLPSWWILQKISGNYLVTL